MMMSDPSDEMIEAGRMVLVDTTGHGYGPELVRAVWEAMRDAEADIRADERERLAKLADAESADEATYEGIARIEWGWFDIAEWLRSQGGE